MHLMTRGQDALFTRPISLPTQSPEGISQWLMWLGWATSRGSCCPILPTIPSLGSNMVKMWWEKTEESLGSRAFR